MAELTFSEFPFPLEPPPIVPGSTWSFSFYLTNDAKQRVVTTGYTFKMHMRETPNGPLVQEISIANGKCVMTPAQGLFVITLTPTDTLALAPYRQLVFDSQLNTTVETLPFFAGKVEVESPVTRS